MHRERPAPVELYLLRHAHAGDPMKWRGPDDVRPLSGKGERQVERLALPLGLEQLESILVDAGDPARLMIVGHDPDFSALVALLCGAPPSVPLRKGALARIDAMRPLRPGSGSLRWLLPPDLLEAGT